MAADRRGRSNKFFKAADNPPGVDPFKLGKSLMHASNRKIFIGDNFQADLPALYSSAARSNYEDDLPSPETKMWGPVDHIADDKLDSLVTQQQGFQEDQILPFLRHRNYSVDAALEELKTNFVSKQEEMPLHDKVLFSQGFKFHGKNFSRIRDLMPSHTLQTLINHYYTDFKRTKQNRYASVRPETEVRKWTTAVRFTAPTTKSPSGEMPVRVKRPPGRPRLIRIPVSLKDHSSDPAANLPNFYKAQDLMTDAAASDEVSPLKSIDGMISAENNVQTMLMEENGRLKDLENEEEVVVSALNTAKDCLFPVQTLVVGAHEQTQSDPSPTWQPHEIVIFMRSLVEFGMDFGKTSRLLVSKTEQQVRNLYQNRAHFYGLEKLVKIHEEKSAALAVIAVTTAH